MSERLTLRLWEPVSAHSSLRDAWGFIKSMLLAGHRLVLEVRPETRSDAQNRLLHSRINDVARQCEWAGKKWDTEDWKRLLVSAWCRMRNEGVNLVPAIDGQGFDVIYRRTSKLSRKECVELSDYVMAWGSDHGVKWSAASLADEAGEIAQPERMAA